MELWALDENFQNVKRLRYINLQWNREYYTVGNFSIQITKNQYDPKAVYIYTPDRTEVGIIHKVDFQKTVKGEFVQLTGFFYESKLNDKIVYPTFYASGSLPQAVAEMVETYKEDIPLITVAEVPSTYALNTAWQETGGNLAKVAYEKLATQELSCRCIFDYENETMLYEVWQGTDKTQDQSEESYVVFSSGFKNLKEVQASFDSSNFKNYAVVAGQGEADERIYTTVDLSNGNYKQKIFIDARNLRYDSTKQTLEEYTQALVQYGTEKMLDYKKINNIEIDVSQTTFKYLEDFDLGTKVDVIIDEIGVELTARVISVHEVFKNNNWQVTIELGDKKLTETQKARLR